VFTKDAFLRKYALYDSTLFLLFLTGFLIGGILLSSSSLFIRKSYGHFEHFTHYNNRGDGVGKYYAYEQIEPEYTRPNEPAKIIFSIQDENSNDVRNVETLIEIYEAYTGDRIKVYPWTFRDVGDFSLYYQFPKSGNYQIVLSIANTADKDSISSYNDGIQSGNRVDPPRDTLSSTRNCNCDRAVFSISVSENFGNIYSSVMLAVVIGPIVVFGLVLGLTFRTRRKNKSLYPNLTNKEALKWSVMLLAIAGGLVHIAIFSEHASLRLEYSIFLLAAGGIQIAYGVLYILVTLVGESIMTTTTADIIKEKKQEEESVFIAAIKAYYGKTMLVNLFGLIGTGVLIGLYTYAIVFPPPLSPNNEPEHIDFAGILAKSIELFLVIGIVYLMLWEKKRMQRQIIHIK
jgi:hypothetical protein